MTTSDSTPRLTPPWGPLTLEKDLPATRTLGRVTLWFLLAQGEIRLARTEGSVGQDPEEGEAIPPTDSASWSRWALPSELIESAEALELRLLPEVPDRGLIVKPEAPFSLLPRAAARIFVRIPLLARVEVARAGSEEVGIHLETLPLVTLSDTWWGSLAFGEMCYWLPTSARRVVGPEHLEPHLAICPLLLENRAAEELKVDELCFRVEHLSLFADREGFWSDESRVRYEGSSEETRIDMTGQPPEEALEPRRISQPRDSERGFRALTFMGLRGIPGWGGGS
jgi:hypothetical protein